MRKLFRILSWIFVILGIFSLIISFFLFFTDKQYFNFGDKLNLEIGNQFGGLIAGLVGIFFSGTGTFLVFLTFEQQRFQFQLSQFESSYFNLLSHLQVLISQLSGPVHWANIVDGNVQGRKFLYYQIRELKDLFGTKVQKVVTQDKNKYSKLFSAFFIEDEDVHTSEPLDLELLKELVKEAYEDFYRTRYSFLGHYFRFVYHLIRFVDESRLTELEKKKYIDLIQSQMTSDELGLLLFNGISKIGINKSYPLLEKYDFLSNLDTRVLPYPALLTKLYPQTHFKYLNY